MVTIDLLKWIICGYIDRLLFGADGRQRDFQLSVLSHKWLEQFAILLSENLCEQLELQLSNHRRQQLGDQSSIRRCSDERSRLRTGFWWSVNFFNPSTAICWTFSCIYKLDRSDDTSSICRIFNKWIACCFHIAQRSVLLQPRPFRIQCRSWILRIVQLGSRPILYIYIL